MNKKSYSSNMIILIITLGLIMAGVDAILSPPYFMKAVIKLILFLGVPILFTTWNKDNSLMGLFQIDKRSMLLPLLLGIGVFSFIIGAYFIIGPLFNFSNVTVALSANYGVKKENFVAVALYISLINSLLEEFFFRGFAFLTLKKLTTRRFAYLFSATTFSLYHIAIMSSWFNLLLFALLIFSLVIAGLLFDWLNEKRGTIYTSWLVHMCANFAINTIGFMLFGIV